MKIYMDRIEVYQAQGNCWDAFTHISMDEYGCLDETGLRHHPNIFNQVSSVAGQNVHCLDVFIFLFKKNN